MRKAKWIKRDLIISPFSIGLCLSEGDFKKELKRLKIPLSECSPWIPGGADGKLWEFRKVKGCHSQCCIVCIKARKKSTLLEVTGLIIHEAVHVWQAIKDTYGERYPSLEFEAYSIQSIAQRLIKSYKGGLK